MRSIIAFLGLVFVHTSLIAATYQELAYQLKSSVVKVHVATKSGGHGVGTGVVVGKDLIATNCHILANSIGVKITKFGESFLPVALKADWKHDLCILRFAFLELKPVELGDSEHLKYEQEIFSIGFPGGPPKPQTTQGKIKALYPYHDSVIVRTDASFVMGASGSPVFDNSGKLIAISTFKSPGKNAYFYNIPVKWVKSLLDRQEVTSMKTDELPFWDAIEENRPFFMRVILPYQNEKWDELNTVAQLWIKQEPKSAEAFYYAAIAQEKLGNLNKSNEYHQQTLALQPQHSATLIALGLMANRAGNIAEVEKTRIALKAIDSALDEEFTEALKPKAN
ncbi:MAG: trypsin-like peptidase domain-containing protein [Methylophilaceae bacterium]